MKQKGINSGLSKEQSVWRWKIIISTYFGYAGYYLTRKVFTISKTSLADSFGVGLDSIAHIWSIYLIAYMLGMFVNSFVGRRWGPRLLLLGGLGTSILINIRFGFTNSYSSFMVLMFFNGLIQASGWPGTVGGIAHWLRKKERGTIMGFWSTNYLVGNIVVKMLGGFLLALWGWRYAFWGATLVAFGIWWLIYFWQRTRPEDVGLEPIVSLDDEDNREVKASLEDRISFKKYLKLLLNPIVPLMGMSYFSIKFLRYALDSWLPTFLNLQGLDKASSAYYSSIFDIAGFGGVVLAGFALDRFFKGRWEKVVLLMSLGLVAGYFVVISYGQNPVMLALSFGLVGFMLYGPDTLLCGAAAVQVAGEKNAVAVAAIVNGIGSIGPVIQEEVIGLLMGGKSSELGMRNTNYLALSMSILLVVFSLIIYLNIRRKLKVKHQ